VSNNARAPGGANPPADEAASAWGSWGSNRERKLTAALAATPAERLAWLEEMIALAYRTGALPKRRE
jgi:hypothetical protein